jgi:phytanoyl-CoA hydroxylase
MGLTETQKLEYRQNGFLLAPSVFSAAALAPAYAVIDELILSAETSGAEQNLIEYEPDLADGVLAVRRLFNPFEQHAAFRALATDDGLLDLVESFVGPNIALQHSKLNMKAHKVGSAVEWHQDLTYFPHTNDDLVGALLFLDDVTTENGRLQVLPRQHFRFLDHSLPDGSFAGMITERIDTGQLGEPVTIEGKAGSVLFLHPLSPHCSATNTSPDQRRVLIFEYRAADAFPIYNGSQIVGSEACAHHLRGERALFARFGGPPPAIYLPQGSPQSLFEIQHASRRHLQWN